MLLARPYLGGSNTILRKGGTIMNAQHVLNAERGQMDASLSSTNAREARRVSIGAPAEGKAAVCPPFVETVDHARLYCKQWGTGAPILFVHSWAMNSDLWQYQMLDLATRGFRCVAYDQRGHGSSSDPGNGFDYDTLSDDLATVIQELDLRGVMLVGHSMGCGVIARYLTRHGASRTARIAFVAPRLPFFLKTADNPNGVEGAVFEQLRAAWSQDFPKWLAGNARPFFTPETSPGMVQWGIGMCLRASLKAVIDWDRAATETVFRTELPGITVPTLIVHGDKDAGLPVEFSAIKTAELITGSRLLIYGGAPHGLMLTHVARLNGDLVAFARG